MVLMLAFACRAPAQVVTGGPVRPLSPEIINPENGHTYLLLSQGNWTDSEAEAVSLGGHLATVRNQAEEEWIWDFFGGYGGGRHDLWIGLHAVGATNRFVWIGGKRATYTDWLGGAPDNAEGLQPYVAMMGFYFTTNSVWVAWGDTTTDFTEGPFNGVVEIDRKY